MTRPPDDDSPHPPPPRAAAAPRRLRIWVIGLLCVIISGAFAFSAETWIGLADVAGFRGDLDAGRVTLRLAWMLPVTVDGYLCLTTWLYLTSRPGSPLRRWAAGSLLGVVALSVVAQGVYHALYARGVDIAQVTPLIVVVGALAPALLASSVHLLSIYLHHRGDTPAPSRSPAPRSRVAARQATPKRTASPAEPPQRLALVQPRDAPRTITDAELADSIRDHVLSQRHIGAEPVQRQMVRLVERRTGVRVGQKRCSRVAATIADSDQGDRDDTDGEREVA